MWLIPPANLLRHLANAKGSEISARDDQIDKYILFLLKAIYCLVDGPLLFQLALLFFIW